MTALLWNKWLKQFDEKLFMENRKIILFIDNCTAHVIIPNLKAITIKFLPNTVTSKLQPLDHGIIQNFKSFYRKEVIRKITSHIELQHTISINLLQAIRIIDKSWRQVRKKPYQEKNDPEWSYVIQKYNLMPEFTFNSYIKIDENLTKQQKQWPFYIILIETTEGMNNIHFEALGTIEDAMDKIKHTKTYQIFSQKKKISKKCGADYVLMELDENTNPFTCEDIKNFHKLAQDNGAVFTTKSLVNSIRQISPIQQFKNINNDEDEISNDLQLAFPSIPEKDISEDRKSYETIDLVEKIQQKFPKHELQFWEFQEISTCLPEVVIAIGIKVIYYY
ncbi:hypothetical protein AGLY_002978 [Aphis glycines]|uniref:DDE-1 domain-containing protein n=1 Tax=Aphis glycines TaxID=307491 RepID=A0A6G0U280_APHGL|nr:hypothetical protein AGLY_002978 [Aphis glycines]